MKIALDATYSVGRNLSGVGVYSRELIAALAAAHPQIRFLCCYRPHRLLRSFHEPLPRNCGRRPLLETIMPGADLFHGLNQRLPSGKLRRAVTTFHDLFVLTSEYSTPEFRKRFAAQARDAAGRSDLILTVSQFTADQVHELLGVERSRLRVVPHGAHHPDPPPDPPDLERTPPVILHVGAIQKRKNVARLVEAFERLPDRCRLVLAGSRGYGAVELIERMRRSPAASRIELTGYVTPEKLDALYRRAAMLAFPSLDEGFGIPVLEAMGYGVPAVTSNCSALPEIAGDAALLVDPRSVDEIAEAMLRLLEDKVLRKNLRDRALSRASAFSWSATAEKTWKAYRELLG